MPYIRPNRTRSARWRTLAMRLLIASCVMLLGSSLSALEDAPGEPDSARDPAGGARYRAGQLLVKIAPGLAIGSRGAGGALDDLARQPGGASLHGALSRAGALGGGSSAGTAASTLPPRRRAYRPPRAACSVDRRRRTSRRLPRRPRRRHGRAARGHGARPAPRRRLRRAQLRAARRSRASPATAATGRRRAGDRPIQTSGAYDAREP
jgi:hypothetical protein